jgi:CheY-like chemotaxis protein
LQLIKILLVEDDPGHARLIEKNLRRGGIANEIVFFTNGQGLLDYLESGNCSRQANGRPLILLDLNLPVMDGYQVLRRLKSGECTRKIPVIILTTTDVPQEVSKCYELGCNLFITKPVQYDELCNAVRNLAVLLSIMKIPSMD